MQGPSLSTLVVVASLGIFAVSTTAGTPDALEAARKKLAQHDGISAAALLEDAVPSAGSSKDAVLGLLQQAYELAASQAEKAGRPKEAETYRENLKILRRKSRPASPLIAESPAPSPIASSGPLPSVDSGPISPPGPISSPARRVDPAIPDVPAEPTPLPDGPPPPLANAPVPELVKPTEPDPLPPVAPDRSPEAKPQPLLPLPAVVPAFDVASGDAAFEAKNYREAGRIYGALAQEKRLPAERLDHWLYCRAALVVARINAKPKTTAEWVAINDELAQMRSLNPSFWLSEYLKDVSAKLQVAQKKGTPSTNKMVVRGQAPEEPARVDRPVRTASNTTSADSVRPSPTPTSTNAAAARIGTSYGRWQILESKNFRIYHADPDLAAKVAKAAETARGDLLKRWPTTTPRGDWSPLCEIYLYPSARQYAQMTGQPEDSPGFSTMGMNLGRINARRINLRVDHPTAVSAVLPHEITHVILADFFTDKQIPRWADEGLAVLSEPQDEQERRAADLATPLAVDKLFPIEALMNMDYPDPRYWSLYYAQSVSLSRFLIEQGSPPQMLQFLQAAQREGYEPALRRVYKIEGYADLQERWLLYAKAKVDRKTADAAPPAPVEPDLKVR
jgi:hypothetical protein